VTGDSFALPGKPGGSITVKRGEVTASTGSDRITIGPAFGDHHFTESMRGSEPQSTGEFTLYFTATTPIDRKVVIEAASI
jgi:hypothetical protein